MDYKISVIVPVYKAEKYLEKCIESLLAQTLESVEIILINDGSPDDSGQICDKYAKYHSNVTVIHLNNGGPSRARNVGLAKAKGRYIAFVDADDYVSKDMFHMLFMEAEKYRADIVMCNYFIDNGEKTYQADMKYKMEYVGKEELRAELLSLYFKRYHSGLYSVCNKLFSRELLLKYQLCFNEDLIRAEDAWFMFECLKVAHKVRYIDKALYYYRQVSTSTMHTIQADRFKRSKDFRLKLLKENMDLGMIMDYDEFFYEFLYECFIYCRSMIQQRNKEAVQLVLDDDFFNEACQYTEYMPRHLKFFCQLEREGHKWLLIKMIQIWGMM